MWKRNPTEIVDTASSLPVRRSQPASTCSRGTSGETSVCFIFPGSRYLTNDAAGIMWAYIFFNFAVVFVCTYLYLGGMRKIISVFKPSARKEKAAKKKQQSGDAV
jgi:ATP-binding cassette subfamily G (WHITE) protein 2 (SNQ2)